MGEGTSGRVNPTCYVGGTFDLFHAGHVRLLSRASEIGPVTVSLNRDEFAARYKRQPVMTLSERYEVVASCMFVDRVIINQGDEDSRPAVLASGAQVIVHGDEWPRAGLLRQMRITEPWLDKHRIVLRQIPYTGTVSTSDILRRVEQRRLVAA